MMASFAVVGCILASLVTPVAAAVPYSEYILTPSSKTLIPASVYNVNGTVENPQALTTTGSGVATFGAASAVTYDFGKNIAGIVSFNVSAVQGAGEYIGISFTESSLWINSEGCDATADSGIDEALWYTVSSGGSYTAEKEHQRGGFRYLNVYHNTSGSVELEHLSIYFTALPSKTDDEMQGYTGYFHSNDDGLNRVWYAGAYTNQMCTIDPTAGDSLVHLGVISSTTTVTSPLAWYNNYTIANGSSVLTDGAKRDRLVWPGDIAISGPSTFVSTNDMVTIKNSLDSLLALQTPNGSLPYAGVPFNNFISFSFTYHLYSLIDIYDYYLYTGDNAYLETNWPKFKLGLNYAIGFIDSSGMANVTSPNDWLRFGMGGHNIEANSILYYTINLGQDLARIVNDTNTTVLGWSGVASKIKSAANSALWDLTANLYRDNDTLPLTTLHPQDGNTWAIISNLTSSPAQAFNISNALRARWGPYGAPAPEAGPTVSPFISGFELQAHYLAGNPSYAIDLIRLMWVDFMLEDPRMTNSTFIEGYSTNGDLHYAPYTNDPRISHAHGWATGPTSTLTFYAAGLQITSAAGKTWSVSPNLGGLTNIAAGFETPLGSFAVNITNTTDSMEIVIVAPPNTSGTVTVPVPYTNYTITSKQTNPSGYASSDTQATDGQVQAPNEKRVLPPPEPGSNPNADLKIPSPDSDVSKREIKPRGPGSNPNSDPITGELDGNTIFDFPDTDNKKRDLPFAANDLMIEKRVIPPPEPGSNPNADQRITSSSPTASPTPTEQVQNREVSKDKRFTLPGTPTNSLPTGGSAPVGSNPNADKIKKKKKRNSGGDEDAPGTGPGKIVIEDLVGGAVIRVSLTVA